VSRAAAFSCVRHELSREEVVVVAETRRKDEAAAQVVASIRARVLADVGLQVDRVELVAPGSIPRTTSGKVQRQLCRDLFLENALHGTPSGDGAS
jgi:acyl-CoA synthetase (AMP-forming)/AMP-acid ligase II